MVDDRDGKTLPRVNGLTSSGCDLNDIARGCRTVARVSGLTDLALGIESESRFESGGSGGGDDGNCSRRSLGADD